MPFVKPRLSLSIVSAAIGAIAVSLLGAQAANAHVTLATSEADAGSYYKGVLRVPHGCNGEATTSIRLQIPEGMISVKPMPKPGWTLTISKKVYARTYESHGKPVTEGVTEINWSAGNLPDEYYDEFVFTGFITDDVKAGQPLYFPVIQQCTTSVSSWTDMPVGGASAKSPAPLVMITAKGAMSAQAQMPRAIKVGSLSISQPWSRATPSGASVAGGYLSVTNEGTVPDRLISATSSASPKVEIHEMSMANGVMQMRPLGDGLTIKPGETVELKPGGLHIMFLDITKPFKQGDSVKATLQFEKAGSVEVVFSVAPLGASAPGTTFGGGGSMEHKH